MKKFPALHSISAIFKILAWIVGLITLGLAGTTMAGVFKILTISAISTTSNIIAGLAILLLGGIYVLILYAMAEAILVVLAIEENTRKTPKPE